MSTSKKYTRRNPAFSRDKKLTEVQLERLFAPPEPDRQMFEYLDHGRIACIGSWTPADDYVVIEAEDADVLLAEHKLATADLIRTGAPNPVLLLTPTAYRRLALEDKPCVWCGHIMGYEVSFNGKDICLDCAGGEG